MLAVRSHSREIDDSQPNYEAVQQPGIGFGRRGIKSVQETASPSHDLVSQFAEERAQSRHLSLV
jgi:hypothetical protein